VVSLPNQVEGSIKNCHCEAEGRGNLKFFLPSDKNIAIITPISLKRQHQEQQWG
jgi:hypothetical protein